jgi:hypothetical protein
VTDIPLLFVCALVLEANIVLFMAVLANVGRRVKTSKRGDLT